MKISNLIMVRGEVVTFIMRWRNGYVGWYWGLVSSSASVDFLVECKTDAKINPANPHHNQEP